MNHLKYVKTCELRLDTPGWVRPNDNEPEFETLGHCLACSDKTLRWLGIHVDRDKYTVSFDVSILPRVRAFGQLVNDMYGFLGKEGKEGLIGERAWVAFGLSSDEDVDETGGYLIGFVEEVTHHLRKLDG